MIDSETVARLLDNIRKNQHVPSILERDEKIKALEISQSQLDSIKLRISELNKVPFATKVSRVPIRDPCPPVSCDSLVPGSLIVKVSAMDSLGFRIRAIEDSTNLIHKQMTKLRESVLEKPREVDLRRKLSSNNLRGARDKCFSSIRKQAALFTKTMDERKPFMSDVAVDEALRAEAFAQNSFCARILNY